MRANLGVWGAESAIHHKPHSVWGAESAIHHKPHSVHSLLGNTLRVVPLICMAAMVQIMLFPQKVDCHQIMHSHKQSNYSMCACNRFHVPVSLSV